MPRLMLNDEYWSKLEKILLQKAIYNKRNLRMTVEGMLYRMQVGCPWRDLLKASGCWNSICKRFNAWSLSSKWLRIFKALAIDPDCEWEFIDGSYVKAHQHSAGAVGKKPQAIGKSRAGNTTKIHLAVVVLVRKTDFLVPTIFHIDPPFFGSSSRGENFRLRKFFDAKRSNCLILSLLTRRFLKLLIQNSD